MTTTIYRMSRTESRQWYDNPTLSTDSLHAGKGGKGYVLYPEYVEQTKDDEAAGKADPGAHRKVEQWCRAEARRHLLQAMGLDERQPTTARDVIKTRARWAANQQAHEIYDAAGNLVHHHIPASQLGPGPKAHHRKQPVQFPVSRGTSHAEFIAMHLDAEHEADEAARASQDSLR